MNDNSNNNNTNLPSASLSATHQQPPSVFCSRGLERELVEFVTGEVLLRGGEAGFPSDGAIRERARVFLGSENTPADDGVLLGKFREMMRGRLGLSQQDGGELLVLDNAAAPPVDMDLSGAMGAELGDVLQHMDFDFSDLGDFMDGVDGIPMDL
jgi:hypothetical protein